MTFGLAYLDAEWEHGLRCADCGVLFVEGMRYSERLEGVLPPETTPGETAPGNAPEWLSDFLTTPTPVVYIVCVPCALSSASGSPEPTPEPT